MNNVKHSAALWIRSATGGDELLCVLPYAISEPISPGYALHVQSETPVHKARIDPHGTVHIAHFVQAERHGRRHGPKQMLGIVDYRLVSTPPDGWRWYAKSGKLWKERTRSEADWHRDYFEREDLRRASDYHQPQREMALGDAEIVDDRLCPTCGIRRRFHPDGVHPSGTGERTHV